MAIKVTCKCGKTFAAKEELRGKKTKCPSCGVALTVTAAVEGKGGRNSQQASRTTQASRTIGEKGTASGMIPVTCVCGKGIQAPAKFAGKQVKCPACSTPIAVPGITGPQDDLSDLLDEVGYDQEKTKDSCPNCAATLPPNAVLCISCGLNIETGKKLRTKSYSDLAKKRNNRTKLH